MILSDFDAVAVSSIDENNITTPLLHVSGYASRVTGARKLALVLPNRVVH